MAKETMGWDAFAWGSRAAAPLLFAVACSGSVKSEGGASGGGAGTGVAGQHTVPSAGTGTSGGSSGSSSSGASGHTTAVGDAGAGAGGSAGDDPVAGGVGGAGGAGMGIGGTVAAGGKVEVAGSAGFAVAGAPSNLGHSCVDDAECTRGICGASQGGTCVLPCTLDSSVPADQAQYFAPCGSGETCHVIFGSTVPKRCFASCSLTDPVSCSVGYGCGDAGQAHAVCLPVGTAAAGQSCTRSLTNTGCKDSGFRCAGDKCRKPCDAAAADPACPSGQVCAVDVCEPLTEGDPAQLGEQCGSSAYLPCGSDGKAFKGYCSQSMCVPLAPQHGT